MVSPYAYSINFVYEIYKKTFNETFTFNVATLDINKIGGGHGGVSLLVKLQA